MQAGVLTKFVGGDVGVWQVEAQRAIIGPALPPVSRLHVESGPVWPAGAWSLAGVGSHLRYTTRHDHTMLQQRQEGLGRPHARCASLIPIRKSAEWWALAQDERDAVMRRARHTPIGADYLPAVARKLYHSRDLGESFDFLTWFEFAEADAPRFDALLAELRETEEWRYVEHEVELRLVRTSAPAPLDAA